jgi:hypothetical protein
MQVSTLSRSSNKQLIRRTTITMIKSVTQVTCVAFCIFGLASQRTMAFELFSINPGARAAAMAGVFAAQADDASAIIYNPGALKRDFSIVGDFSFEVAQLPYRETRQRVGVSRYGDSDTDVRFAAAYVDHIPFLTRSDDPIATGLAYTTLYRLQIDVDAPQSNVTPEPFGVAEANYHQGSWVLAARVNQRLSVGATADFVWADINCLQFDVCVTSDPNGWGATIGLKYGLIQSTHWSFNLGLAWRSRVTLKYGSTPSSGIGSILGSYLPARPEKRAVGLNLQLPRSWAFININTVAEHVLWSNASGMNPQLPDYSNWGIGGEILIPHATSGTWSARAGYKISNSEDKHKQASGTLGSLGIGVAFLFHHSIDLTYEYRTANDTEGSADDSLSLAYSYQY